MNDPHLSAAIAAATVAIVLGIAISIAWWLYRHPQPGLFRGGSVTGATIDYRVMHAGDLVASRSTTTGVILPRDASPGGVIFYGQENGSYIWDGNPSDTRDLRDR